MISEGNILLLKLNLNFVNESTQLWNDNISFSVLCVACIIIIIIIIIRVSLQYFTTHTDLVARQQEAIRQRKAVRKGLQSDKDWTGDGFVQETESMVSNWFCIIWNTVVLLLLLLTLKQW